MLEKFFEIFRKKSRISRNIFRRFFVIFVSRPKPGDLSGYPLNFQVIRLFPVPVVATPRSRSPSAAAENKKYPTRASRSRQIVSSVCGQVEVAPRTSSRVPSPRMLGRIHHRRPRGGQSDGRKGATKVFQVRATELFRPYLR